MNSFEILPNAEAASVHAGADPVFELPIFEWPIGDPGPEPEAIPTGTGPYAPFEPTEVV